MADAAEQFLAVEQEAEESALEEEGVEALHGEGLADDGAGVAGEARPVGAELELHRDAGDDAKSEVDGEDAGPEAGAIVVVFVFLDQRHGLEDEDQEAEPQGELHEQVVESDREGELKAVQRECGIHVPASMSITISHATARVAGGRENYGDWQAEGQPE